MNERILVVEDDADILRVVVAFLEREGYRVETARDGAIGLERALGAAPDLVILDWMLPVLDGPAFLSRLRREHDTPVIMLTARTEEDDRISGLETGADDYVTKPFSPRELVARVRAVLRRRAASTDDGPGSIEHRGLRVDAAARTVERGGRRAEVTTVEFDLLYALASTPGRVFRRTELLDRVWGEGFEGVDRVVDVHVSHLRRKLEPLGADGMIVTVRAVGYKFE
jgi:two-component system alkaline phosphatase synthesis response regulator PhoP